MAVIVPTVNVPRIGVLEVTWGPMGTGDSGAPFSASGFPGKTVSVEGTTVTAVSIEGSADGANWRQLNDTRGEGNALTFAAADIREVLENPPLIRPLVTTGTAVTVKITLVK